jgi:hypothetical protein
VAEEWYAKGEEVCGDLLEDAEKVLKEAEEREAAESRVRIMESECEELAGLADQAEKQATTETEPEPLIELAEEIEHKRGNVASLAQTLKETMPIEFTERAQQAVLDSIKIAEKGKHWLEHLRARLKFRSADSETGSYIQRAHGDRSSSRTRASLSGKGTRGREENGGRKCVDG